MIQQHREQCGLVGAMTMEELLAMLRQLEVEPNTLSVVMGKWTNQEWKKVESTWSLEYNDKFAWMKRHQAKIVRDKETEDEKMRKG